MNPSIGPSTWVTWATAVALAVIAAFANGQSWLLAVSAGLVAVNNIARAYQAAGTEVVVVEDVATFGANEAAAGQDADVVPEG